MADNKFPARNSPEHKYLIRILDSIKEAHPLQASRMVSTCLGDFPADEREYLMFFDANKAAGFKETVYATIADPDGVKHHYMGWPALDVVIDIVFDTPLFDTLGRPADKPQLCICTKTLRGGDIYLEAVKMAELKHGRFN